MNIYDIAEKSGVSIATVSRVLNNSRHVREKTRERVLGVMQDEGYVPNAFARGLGLDTMRMIGVMCTDVTDMFYAQAVGRIESALKRLNMDVILRCTGSDIADKRRVLCDLVNRRVDAIILIGSAFKEEKDNSHIRDAAREVPVIIVNGYVNLQGVYCVVCDERGAMRDNVSYLAACGMKRILYLYDVLTYSGSEKLAGYKEGCKDCEIAIDERLLLKTEKSVDGTAKAVAELYKSGVRFDAVLAAEDILAAGALAALRSIGISVPVIGFNNSIVAECTSPSLTSVDNMLDPMCETAVRILGDIATNKQVAAKTMFSAELIERESFRRNKK